MSPASAAAAWSTTPARASKTRRKKGSKPGRPPLVEIPSQFVRPVEEIMAALTVNGQREFKEELHRAVESSNPGAEMAHTVSAWNVSMYMMLDPEFSDALHRLPELLKQSEDLTMEEFTKQIGL